MDVDIKVRPCFLRGCEGLPPVTDVSLHNGTLGYDCSTFQLSGCNKEMAPPKGAVAISFPVLNACNGIIIKSKKDPNKFAAGHIRPGQMTKDHIEYSPDIYQELLKDFEEGDELEIVSFNEVNKEMFLKACAEKGLKISSFQSIDVGAHYSVQRSMVDSHKIRIGGSEGWSTSKKPVKEADSAYIVFFPEEDKLIVYADKDQYGERTCVHVVEQVFDRDTQQPLEFMEFAETISSPAAFMGQLARFTDESILRDPTIVPLMYQQCPDEIASTAEGKKQASLINGYGFLSDPRTDLLQNQTTPLKDDTNSTSGAKEATAVFRASISQCKKEDSEQPSAELDDKKPAASV